MAEDIKDNNGQNNNGNKKRRALMIFGVIVIVGFIIGFFYLQYSKNRKSTDDAYIEGPIHMISPKVSGEVKSVHISDNQQVKAGDLLVEIDPEVYEQKLKEAETSMAVETRLLSEIEASIDVQHKKIQISGAGYKGAISRKNELNALLSARDSDLMTQTTRLKQAEIDYNRAKNLFEKGVVPKDMYDKAKTAYDAALSEKKSAEEIKRQAEIAITSQDRNINQVDSQNKVDNAVINQLEDSILTQKEKINRSKAVVDLAKIDLSYTKIYAPADGYITKKNVEIGNYIRTGQALMAIVPLNEIFVVANFKENQMTAIKPGQRVEIKADAYPGKIFIGHVESIMSGTGAAFSLFPSENATGNFVKVVQRIPIKIVFEKGSGAENLLKVGMSVVPTVITK
ncbi:MAG: HlyD family secretion protein [Nitrospirae bacterium]|nr:HlyD family secretion protein [Nitrospirota bacterium]